jgi:hypothetical protein
MKRKIRLLRTLPFLGKLFSYAFSKFLDFTDYPRTKGYVELLIRERDFYLQQKLTPQVSDAWNLEIIDTLAGSYLPNIALLRMGSDNDGGYFVPDFFSENHLWLCIGLGTNVDFENSLALRNCQVICFDHTISNEPKNLNKNIRFISKGWGSIKESQDDSSLISLDAMVRYFPNNRVEFGKNWSLKFDIEGNEWKCLQQIHQLDNKPSVIVCELHGLLQGSIYSPRIKIVEILNLLLEEYHIVFMNGNNFSPYLLTDKYGIYDVIELTFIKKVCLTMVERNKNVQNYVSKNNPFVQQMPLSNFKPSNP